jgi:hypothetical protein
MNMNEFTRLLNKYLIVLIVSTLFGMPWVYLRYLVFENFGPETIIEYIPKIVEYSIKIIVIILLIIDMRKYKMKNIIVTCFAALLFPLLGIVMFTISLLLQQKNEANA